MSERIEPRVLKGFRDTLPTAELLRRELERRLETTFRLFGFVPIDTPVLEYSEILLGKGGGDTDKQVYRFTDHGGRDVAMRFDLTVPFARFLATHGHELPFPFRRYHISKVWRGENTQRGRYREFFQCDFDIVGADDAAADFEIIAVIDEALTALGVDDFTIRIAHRGLFNRYLDRLGVRDRSTEILRVVDKLRKIGEESVKESITKIVGRKTADAVVEYVRPESDFDRTLSKIEELCGGENEDSHRMMHIRRRLRALELEERVVFDPSITRGLDYYTGVVFETFLTGLESFGSVCSGGRYNDLASLYTDRHYPGVGASIGLDRLIAALGETKVALQPPAVPSVAILSLDESLASHYDRIARSLRRNGISCVVFFEKKRLAAQFDRAEKLGAHVAIICGEDEYRAGKINLRRLTTRESFNELTVDEAITRIRMLIDGPARPSDS